MFGLVAVVAALLLLVTPWATRRRLRDDIVEEALAAAAMTFERPVHRGDAGAESVTACLEASLGRRDGGIEVPPVRSAPALSEEWMLDGGAAWLERVREDVAVVRSCLGAPRVGAFQTFGYDCGPAATLDTSRVLQSAMLWLRAEAMGHVPAARPLEACLDVTALERDGPALEGLIGAMLSASSAHATLEPCAGALTRAPHEERSAARAVLERIEPRLVPFSTVLRLERATMSVSIVGGLLGLADDHRLPSTARACVGSLDLVTEPSMRFWVWATAPNAWSRLRQLEALAETDPRLESPAAQLIMHDVSFIESLVPDPLPSDWTRFARRADNTPRKTRALLTLLDALEGRPTTPPPWLKVSVSPTNVHLEVEFDDGWKTVDLER
ncbi:MAG: hypothetical protein SFW67_36085 [Myxococcaceae bacterium]|nr:hypothetical protein [Myxococcaceae bacterium]